MPHPPQELHVRSFDNGMTLLVQPMPGVKSAAFDLRLAAGAATDPVERCGSATVLAEMVLRGAGERNARQLTEAMDDLRIARGGGAGVQSVRFSWAGLAEKATAALPIHADIVRRPTLTGDAFGPSRELALQALAGLADNPQSLAMIKLREWFWPSPYSRNAMGETKHLEKLTVDAVREDFSERWRAGGAMLSVAGDVELDQIAGEVEKHFGDWATGEAVPIETTAAPGAFRFIEQDSQQTHIAMACQAPAESSDDYYVCRLAVEVLSGGMSGRLFDRIREKQGLCYSVYAGYTAIGGPNLPVHAGAIQAYAGTSNDRAQATLDALLRELTIIREGAAADELERAKVGLKAGLVMAGESTSARAASLAGDWLSHGRLRTLDEILAAIDAVTLDRLNDWLAGNPLENFTTVLIGPEKLEVKEMASAS